MGKKKLKAIRRQARNTEEQVQEQMQLPLVDVMADIRASVMTLVVMSGMKVIETMLEEDRERLCGARKHARQQDREYARGGNARGNIALGGRRVAIRRPRVHRAEGGKGSEVPLPLYEQFANDDPLTERMIEQMVLGVSTRKYKRSLEVMPVEAGATSKSAVSRRFVARTRAELDTWMKQPLQDLEIVALLLDGIGFGDHTIVVALGIDATGKKHPLAMREGSTENTELCKSMLADIVARGVPADRALLVVIDGGKGAHAAVREVFGQYAVIQRCQVHKKRNVLGHLPKHLQETARAALNRAYASPEKKKARDILVRLASSLENEHPSAAESLREGLDEILTVHDLGLGTMLRRGLSSTNAIESMFSTVRRVSRRVSRWRGGKMALRWGLAGIQEAQKKFRRLMGHGDMPKLIAALRRHDKKLASAAA